MNKHNVFHALWLNIRYGYNRCGIRHENGKENITDQDLEANRLCFSKPHQNIGNL